MHVCVFDIKQQIDTDGNSNKLLGTRKNNERLYRLKHPPTKRTSGGMAASSVTSLTKPTLRHG